MFVATDQRRRRNVLAGPLHPAEVRHLSCFNSEFEKATKVYGALATLAMGDAQAVEIAQTCHVSMALQGGIAGEGNLLTLSGFHPRSSTMVGIIIDDFVSLSIVNRSQPGPYQCSDLSDKMDSQYDAVGLISHKEKGFRGETQGSFWGVDIDGEEGLLRGSLKRAIPLVGILIRTAKLGHASVGLLQILAGSIVFSLSLSETVSKPSWITSTEHAEAGTIETLSNFLDGLCPSFLSLPPLFPLQLPISEPKRSRE